MLAYEVPDQSYSVIGRFTATNAHKSPRFGEIYAVILSHMLPNVISPAVHFLAALHITGKLLGCIRTCVSHLLWHVHF